MFTFWRNHWYYIGGVIFVGLAFFLTLFGSDLNIFSRLMTASFMSLLLHQFEEYALPGGFPMVWNMAVEGQDSLADRYPLNKLNAFMVNVVMLYPPYIIAILFPRWYILGLVLTYANFLQIVSHGIVMNRKMKSFYNPGLAAALLIMVPVGIFYIFNVVQTGTMDTKDWLISFALLPLIPLIGILLPTKLFEKKDSSYPWSEEECQRYNVSEKLAEAERVDK